MKWISNSPMRFVLVLTMFLAVTTLSASAQIQNFGYVGGADNDQVLAFSIRDEPFNYNVSMYDFEQAAAHKSDFARRAKSTELLSLAPVCIGQWKPYRCP